MDRFASCYFCGDAFDASLSEYSVVPTELQPADDGPTVVLCGTCRRKLGAVVEEVVDAAEGETATHGTTADRKAAADPADTEGGVGSGDGSVFEAGAEDGGEADSQEPTTTAEEWESPGTDADSDGGPDTEADSEREATETAATASDNGDDSATPEDDTGGAEPRLTKLEYNKVMRLLKNRQFPVDKAEIREVATSAYDIEPQEFDAVIEAAVSRDLIGVENGQFVDPE